MGRNGFAGIQANVGKKPFVAFDQCPGPQFWPFYETHLFHHLVDTSKSKPGKGVFLFQTALGPGCGLGQGVRLRVGTIFDLIFRVVYKAGCRHQQADPRHKAKDNGFQVLKPANENIKRTLQLVKAMLELADDGDARREDVGCGVLYGILRDAGYKIKKAAEAEKTAHRKKGDWP